MTDDREPFREARAAGLKARHEQRLENATYTAAEVKVLTEAALRLGRKEALEEQLAQVEDAAERWQVQQERWDIGTPEQRGTPAQVSMAWHNNGELRCWAKHLRHADDLLSAPDIDKEGA